MKRNKMVSGLKSNPVECGRIETRKTIERKSMSSVLTPPPEPAPNRIRITRAMCDNLIKNDLLTGRYELIDGEVISKVGQNPPHAFVINRLMAWVAAVFGVDFMRVQVTMEVAAEDNEINRPEPDVVVTAQPATAYLDQHPGPADVLLVVEVSDTTLRFDLRNKILLYARAGIAEYWVADIVGRRFIVHRQPEGERYTEVLEYGAEDMISPLSRPEASVRVADLLPPM
jgi:Uma2 family endonuclease